MVFLLKKYQRIADNQRDSTAEFFQLQEEMREKFGIQQLEVVNTLQGYHTANYVAKYEHIRNAIPVGTEEQRRGKNKGAERESDDEY